MSISITFLGAARSVTGSRYLLEVGASRVLIDCGMYQERALRGRNWEPFVVSPDRVDAILLTHAHLDHCGLVPKLVQAGYAGPIYCTSATGDIARIIMLDAAKIQEEDAEYKTRRHRKQRHKGPRPVEPLYTRADAERAAKLLRDVPYDQPVDVAPGIQAHYHDSGHILGATSIALDVSENGTRRRIVFSGDIGRWDVPILRNPTLLEQGDYVVMESTYGNRKHEDASNINDVIADAINETCERGGNIIIPSFAVERSQELLYRLHELKNEKRIPDMMVFLDSPMAVRVTEVFKRHPDLFDAETMKHLEAGTHPCDFGGLQLTRTAKQSKAINQIRGSVIVIAGSGMCTGGRIKHHLARNIARPESTVLFVGYQAVGTLGREIVDGAEEIRIHGRYLPVKATVRKVGGFSGHADQDELLRWASGFDSAPKKIFITHGEIRAAEALQTLLLEKFGYDATVPEYRERVVLE
ncbi:MAG: MBL fold metallo-hydrolase [Verrucomicrobia bacterium]|nr:MBL fold metallo-hydrolase [Verrucomicrobiota bacterium]MDA1086610.1 MBL fold metallo-hydrolase [Verrucomicrobiota bacterium]